MSAENIKKSSENITGGENKMNEKEKQAAEWLGRIIEGKIPEICLKVIYSEPKVAHKDDHKRRKKMSGRRFKIGKRIICTETGVAGSIKLKGNGIKIKSVGLSKKEREIILDAMQGALRRVQYKRKKEHRQNLSYWINLK